MKIYTVLVADDTPEMAQMVALLLKECLGNVECVCVTGGQEALDTYYEAKANRCGFDLLILDMAMPEVGGLDVAQEIRGQDRETKIAFLTAYTDYENKSAATMLGVEGPWAKPVDVTDLCARVTEYLNRPTQ